MSRRRLQRTAAGRSGMSAAYGYDPEDRRTKKTANGVVTRMLSSGAEELAQLDASGAVLRRFVPGPAGMDDRIAYVEANGTVTWPHTDRLGSVVAVSNGAGQATDVTGYSPWGETPAGRTLPPGGVFGYTGRERDGETGLWQYRARYYHERGGFFLSTDPAGTKDDPNLYLYVANDPVNKTDPEGNFLKALAEIVIGVVHGTKSTLTVGPSVDVVQGRGGVSSAGVLVGAGPKGELRVGVFATGGVAAGRDVSVGATATVIGGDTSNVKGWGQQVQGGGGPVAFTVGTTTPGPSLDAKGGAPYAGASLGPSGGIANALSEDSYGDRDYRNSDVAPDRCIFCCCGEAKSGN